MFDYRKPCNDCPFRRSKARLYELGAERIKEIWDAPAFECHKTTGVAGEKKSPQQCAGLIAAQHAAGELNQITQIATRITSFDPADIDTSDTFDNFKELCEAHSGPTKG
jgi:hypothetical protein